jgi:E3 ubiquitin-protein ligase TRIP12
LLTLTDGVFDARAYSERALTKLNRASRHSTRLEPGGTGASTIKPKKDSEIRIELLKSKPDLVSRFTRAIVPVLVDVYAASVSQRVRLKVLMGLLKAVAFAEPEELQAVLHVGYNQFWLNGPLTRQSVPMASFLAAIISSKDNPMFVLAALQLVECLVEKLPQVYHSSFRREGVVYEVELLAGQETQAAKTPVVKTEPGEHVASIDEEDGPKPIVLPDLGRARTPSTPADLMDANIFRARILGARRTFETADGEQDNAALALHQLELLVARLGDDTADEDQLRETMREIASHFNHADGVLSSFELLKSGLVDALLTFVTADGSGEF